MTLDDYRDILYLPRPSTGRRSAMDPAMRAAIFATFSALTGLKERLEERAAQHAAQRNFQGKKRHISFP